MKPYGIIGYRGGKYYLREQLVKLFPNSAEYREPFVGGGSVVGLAMYKKVAKKYWINDANGCLISFYELAKQNPVSFAKHIETMVKKVHKTHSILIKNETDRIASLFIQAKMGMNGLEVSRNITDKGLHELTDFQYNKLFSRTMQISLENICVFRELLRVNKVKITNYDFTKVVRADGENVFLYLDPPYYLKAKNTYYGKYSTIDHELLAKNLEKTKHKFVLSYENSATIKNLYKFACVKRIHGKYANISTQNGFNKMDAKHELVITNLPTNKRTNKR